MYIPPPAAYTNTIHNTKCSVYNGLKAFMKCTAIEESSSTYIRGLSKVNANILGI